MSVCRAEQWVSLHLDQKHPGTAVSPRKDDDNDAVAPCVGVHWGGKRRSKTTKVIIHDG